MCTHPHPLPSPLSLSLSLLSLSLSAVCLTQALICRCEIVCGLLRGGPLCDPTCRESVPGRCPVWSLSLIPPVLLGVRLWRLRSQGGELIPLNNQLSGAVGGRASGALISIVKASLRAVFRGGSFVDGCGTAAQTVLRRCLRLLRRVACCSLRWRRTRLVTRQGLMLCRDVRRMRPGGEGACVTTLLEMPFGAQR